MSYQEKQALAAIISNILTTGVYAFYRFQGLDIQAPLDFQFWGSSILLYLLVLIIFRILIYIIFSIINTIITREDEPSITDEMDKLIDMKATMNFYNLFMLGFFLSVGTLLLDLPPASLFIGIMASMFISGLLLEISRFYFYRKGL